MNQEFRQYLETWAEPEELGKLPLFAGMDAAVLSELFALCPVYSLSPGQVFIRPGDEVGELYVLLSGCLAVSLEAADGARIASLGPGECVGELAILEGRPASVYVVGQEPSRVLAIDRDVFWDTIETAPALARNLLQLLARRLRGSNGVLSNERRALRDSQRHATIDELTGAHNRRWFNNMLKRQHVRAAMGDAPLCLVMVDVDHFKRYNDEHGHLAGDQALRVVSDALAGNLRPSDMLARFGGEEFVVILPDTDLDGARIVAERLRVAVAATAVRDSDDRPLPRVTVSLGVARLQPLASAEQLIADADAALYKAKRGGRNRVVA